MATRKVIDLYVAADTGRLTDASAVTLRDNIVSARIIRGDELLIRWTIFATENSTTAFALPLDSGLECAIAETVRPSDYMGYSQDTDFVAADWSSYSKANGKVCCRMSMNTTNLIDNIVSATSKDYLIELVMTEEGQTHHVKLCQATIPIQNDVYRQGEGTSTIVLNPFAGESMSSSSSSQSSSSSTLANSTSSQSSSSSSSSSTGALSTSSQSTSSSDSSTQINVTTSSQSSTSESSDDSGSSSSLTSASSTSESSANSSSSSSSPNLSSQSSSSSSSSTAALLLSSSSSTQISSQWAMLLHFNGANGATSFQDDSDYDRTVSGSSGAALTTSQKKFGSASCDFDGVNDRVSASTGTTEMDLGTNDFTVDMWFRRESGASAGVLMDCGVDASNFFRIQQQSTAMNFIIASGGPFVVNINASATVTDAVWHHVEVTRSGSTFRLFFNGTEIGSDTWAGSMPNADALYMGSNVWGSTVAHKGQIDEVRYVNGTAYHTANFTPPTSEYANPDETSSSSTAALMLSSSSSSNSSSSTETAGNTVLLMHMDDVGLKDDSDSQHATTLHNGAARSASQSKFNGYSAYFDGVNDRVSVVDSSDFTFGSNPCCVDMWVYPDDQVASSNTRLFQTIDNGFGILIVVGTGGDNRKLSVYVGDSTASSWSVQMVDITTLAQNTWQHIAVTWDGSTVRSFVDGIQQGSASKSDAMPETTGIVIGGRALDNARNYKGYIDELRVVNGNVVWTSNFTPPTSAYAQPNESSSSSSSP